MFNKGLFATVLLLAACADTPEAGLTPTAVSVPTTDLTRLMKEDESMISSGAEFWRRLSPEEKAAAIRTVRRVYQEHGDEFLRPRVMLADEALPEGAVAIVVREPGYSDQPLIAFFKNEVTIRAISLAHTAMRNDVMRHSTPESRRILVVASDGRVTEIEREVRQNSKVELPSAGSDPRENLADRLIRAASSTARVNIPGIGTGTLFSFM